jgi:hypothetical protein
MRKFATYLLCFWLIVLPGCAAFTPEQRSQAEQRIEDALTQHQITQAQHDAAIEALNTAPGGVNWAGLGTTGLNVLLALLGVPGGVFLTATAVHSASARAAAARLANAPTPDVAATKVS